jgi:adenylate cyclase, class 2
MTKLPDVIIVAMAKSKRENEIKLAFPSPAAAVSRLLGAGATTRHAREFEDNALFDLSDRRLSGSGRLLRLRAFGEVSLLTFKAPVEGEHRHKVKIEHETAVADPEALQRILLGLGFEIVYRYQKYRATYALGAVAASVDETPLGTFVELEGDPDDVDRAAEALGAEPSQYIRETYRELQETDAARRGVTPGDMLMPDPPGAESQA